MGNQISEACIQGHPWPLDPTHFLKSNLISFRNLREIDVMDSTHDVMGYICVMVSFG